MLEFIRNEANRAWTENGALTHASTFSHCLDLFATVGALRSADTERITHMFRNAYAEDPDLAMRILFFARDARGGLGERRVFRVIWEDLAEHAPGSVRRNLRNVAEYGRWDDLLCLLGTCCETDALELIGEQLEADMAAMAEGHEVSLLAKWLPSINTSNADAVRMAHRIARHLGMTAAEYRRSLSALRRQIRILENYLRERDYTFSYAAQPSAAMYRYRAAFLRNDGERYRAFMDRVSRGEEQLHTVSLTPYDIIAPVFRGGISADARRVMDVTWNAQADFTNGENALVVVDGSGSMYTPLNPSPAAVALSLGIYFAQRNTGIFHNHFITFSEFPRLVQIQGQDIYEQVQYCRRFNEVANTNLQRVFELILQAAVRNNVPQSQMPSTLYIISDMEFDRCARGAELTNFQYAQLLFREAGYELPRVVFWNVASRNSQQPVTMNEQGVALVSGCSPRIFDMLSSGNLSPMGYMLDILGSGRYAGIAA